MSDHSNGAGGLKQRILDQLNREQKIIEELSDEELDIVSGASIGHLVTLGEDYVHSGEASFHSSEASSHSSVSDPKETPAGNANNGHGVSKAWLATSAGLASGGAAAFSVGAVAGKLSATSS